MYIINFLWVKYHAYPTSHLYIRRFYSKFFVFGIIDFYWNVNEQYRLFCSESILIYHSGPVTYHNIRRKECFHGSYILFMLKVTIAFEFIVQGIKELWVFLPSHRMWP